MRELFISERRYLENVLRMQGHEFGNIGEHLVSEFYSPPRTSSIPRFNNDFSLYFVPNDCIVNCKSYCAPILPNAMGADVFVTVDSESGMLLMSELLGGEAFPIAYYQQYVEIVEARLEQLSNPVNFRRTSYCRTFVVDNDICFLAFLSDNTPVPRGKKRNLFVNADSSIVCGVGEDGMIYVDGWIRSHVAQSDKVIEAVSV